MTNAVVLTDDAEIKKSIWSSFANHHVVVDVGAGVGSYTLHALAKGALVYAFEPNINKVETLVRNALKNELGGARLHISAAYLYSGEDYPEELAREQFGDLATDLLRTIRFDTLDAVIARLNPERIDFLRVNAEGAEFGILMGARKVLEKYRPGVFVEDCSPTSAYCRENDTSGAITSLLTEYNYKVNREPFDVPGRAFIVGVPIHAAN